MNKWLMTASISLVFTMSGVQAAGNAEQGKAKAMACGACHGADGNSPANGVPIAAKLAGQHAKYIEKQLHDFKASARKNAIMNGMAAPLSDQDMADIAAYFSSQTRKGGMAAADQVALGQKIYRAGNKATGVAACMACHGPTGSGNPEANFPSLSGQHAAYVAKALKDFRTGTRTNDPNQMMQGVAAHLSDAEITAVAQYVQGLSK